MWIDMTKGILRSSRMRTPSRMSRQMGITLFTRKDAQGQTAPYHIKTEMLRSMSIVGWSESSWVSIRNLEGVK